LLTGERGNILKQKMQPEKEKSETCTEGRKALWIRGFSEFRDHLRRNKRKEEAPPNTETGVDSPGGSKKKNNKLTNR